VLAGGHHPRLLVLVVVGGVSVGLRWPVMTLDGLVAEAGEALGRARSLFGPAAFGVGFASTPALQSAGVQVGSGVGGRGVCGRAVRGQAIGVVLVRRCRRWIPRSVLMRALVGELSRVVGRPRPGAPVLTGWSPMREMVWPRSLRRRAPGPARTSW